MRWSVLIPEIGRWQEGLWPTGATRNPTPEPMSHSSIAEFPSAHGAAAGPCDENGIPPMNRHRDDTPGLGVSLDPVVVRPSLGVVVTYEQIRRDIFPRFYGYTPSMRSLQRWLFASRLRKIKTNPRARGGGGVVHFNRKAVEDWLRRRTGS